MSSTEIFTRHAKRYICNMQSFTWQKTVAEQTNSRFSIDFLWNIVLHL